jgi:integrase
MHRFAKAAGRYEALVRTFTDTGMRLGEVLPLRPEDFDGETLQVRRTAHEGRILEGTKDRPRRGGRRPRRPRPRNPRLDARSPDQPQRPRLQTPLPNPSRPPLARAHLLPRCLEADAEASGLDIRPHECRHSYVTHLRAEGVNDADLAKIAGYRVETMLALYTHAIGESFFRVRRVIG